MALLVLEPRSRDPSRLRYNMMSDVECDFSSPEDGIHLSVDDSNTTICATCAAYILEGRLKFSNPTIAAHEVVHQKCSECDAFKVDESQLCDFCVHIRPYHIMTCGIFLDMEGYGHSSFANYKYSVMIGTSSELKSRQGRCAFCRWCLKVVQAQAQLHIEEEKRIYIFRDIVTERLFHTEGSIVYMVGTNNWGRRVRIVHNKGFGKAYVAAKNATSTDLNQDFSVVPPVVDWNNVVRWKVQCEQKHMTCRERAVGKLPHHFRLIDVAKKRIIDAGNNNTPSFFALSYVWGADAENDTALLQKNLSRLQQSGSLIDLPQTISDAMRVCERLDQPYLWVDRLCILQDDKKDKYGQIRSLEAIYSRAELVIVAACGENMHFGLAGMDGKSLRDQCQFTVEVFGFILATKAEEPADILFYTKWDKRGWTYQEAVLARRKLYFTSTELWFECTKGIQRESTSSLANGDRLSRVHHLTTYGSRGIDLSGDIFEEYRHHLTQYSRRHLTYPSDIYHAFQGIEAVFYPENEIIFGLPVSDFSRALLWHNQSDEHLGIQERESSDRNIVLPSWSWSSLMTSIQFFPMFTDADERADVMGGSFYCSICSWATLAQNDQQSLYPIKSIHDDKIWESLDKMWRENEALHNQPTHRQLLALAWAKGCIESDAPTDLCIISAPELALRWPTTHDFWTDVQNGKHQRKDRPRPPGLDQGRLLTRAQSSVMCVELLKTSTIDVYFIRHAHAHGGDGEIVGALLGNGEYTLRGPGIPEGVTNVDFIAVALGSMPAWIAAELDEKTLGKNIFYDRHSGFDFTVTFPGIIVMAVRWTGSIARRIALGWVTLQGWVDSKPEFRTVVLA